VEAVGVRPCRNVWMLAFLCSWRSCLSSCVVLLSNFLACWCSVAVPFFPESSFFSELLFHEDGAVRGRCGAGVAVHPAHCMMSVMYFTASSIWPSVLSGKWRVRFVEMGWRK
jgi:hypothetical protein